MDSLEFKLNYYFNMYKDSECTSTKEFKENFIKKHGNFVYLRELVLMINKYQIKKYKTTIVTDNNLYGIINSKKINISDKNRIKDRFGTAKEREARKYEAKYR